MRKPRPDSVLDHLAEEILRDLHDWLMSGMSYAAVREELESKHGIATSSTALHNYYHDKLTPELLRRRALALQAAESVASEAQRTPGQWDAAAIEALKQRVFELTLKPGSDPQEIRALFTLVLKARDQDQKTAALDLEDRRVKLLEDKAARLDQLEAKARQLRDDGGLTDETIELLEKQLRLL